MKPLDIIGTIIFGLLFAYLAASFIQGLIMIVDQTILIHRIAELEEQLSNVLEWAEMVAGHSDFEQSDILQEAIATLNWGQEC